MSPLWSFPPPLKSMCSTQWEIPVTPGLSFRDPTRYIAQQPDTGAFGISRIRTLRPLSKTWRLTCSSKGLRRVENILPCSNHIVHEQDPVAWNEETFNHLLSTMMLHFLSHIDERLRESVGQNRRPWQAAGWNPSNLGNVRDGSRGLSQEFDGGVERVWKTWEDSQVEIVWTEFSSGKCEHAKFQSSGMYQNLRKFFLNWFGHFSYPRIFPPALTIRLSRCELRRLV